jgi:sulfate permease, SulP family
MDTPTLTAAQLRTQWQQALQPQQLIPAVVAGLISGIHTIMADISLASLIFSGVLAAYLSRGIGFLMIGTCVLGVIVTLTSSRRGAITSAQDAPAAILTVVAAAIVGKMPATASAESVFLTVETTIVITSMLTGVFFWILGRWQLGNLIRFVPYPVVGGFLAGTGWLLCQGGISVMTNLPLTPAHLLDSFQLTYVIKWLPGVVFAVLLTLLLRRCSHFLLLPGMLFAGIVLFYLILLLTRTSVAEARVEGWLIDAFPDGSLWQPLTLGSLTQVHWPTIAGETFSISAVVLTSTLALLLNASGLELVVQQDLDLNRELKANGFGNLAAGCLGSPPGYTLLGLSALTYRLGARSRLVGLITAAVCAGALFFGAPLLAFFPKPIIGALLFFQGFSFLTEWLYDAQKTLPIGDYALVLLIVGVIAGVGFMPGVLVGILAAVVLFVINYSRIDVVKHAFSGEHYRSHVDRPPHEHWLLRQHGEQVYLLKLQGFMFFGTANNLLNRIRQRAADTARQPLRYLVLDFHLITGMDSSVLHIFTKIHQLAAERGFYMVLTGLSPAIAARFTRRGFTAADDSIVRVFPTLNQGVEWCEAQILAVVEENEQQTPQEQYSAALHDTEVFDALIKQCERQESWEALLEAMGDYLERRELRANEVLIPKGAPAEGVYLIESGRVVVRMTLQNGDVMPLRVMGPGAVVGELGLYTGQPASADVIAQEPGTAYYLSRSRLEDLEQTAPTLALNVHKFLAGLISERLITTNQTLQATLDYY